MYIFMVEPIYKMGRSVVGVGSPFVQNAYVPDAIAKGTFSYWSTSHGIRSLLFY